SERRKSDRARTFLGGMIAFNKQQLHHGLPGAGFFGYGRASPTYQYRNCPGSVRSDDCAQRALFPRAHGLAQRQ
ncbi:MAG: hypothetical protein WA763_20855, partial [Pseudolabrys sp.]